MRFCSFDLSIPVSFYKGGEFTADEPWQHNPMYHNGDYELFLCIEGPIYLQIEGERTQLNKNDVLLIPPYTQFAGYKDSQKKVDFYWLHFFAHGDEAHFEISEQEILRTLQKETDTKHRIALPLKFQIQDSYKTIIDIYKILSLKAKYSYIDERDYLTSVLLIELSKIYQEQKIAATNQDSTNYVKEWIRANMSANLTVAEIAGQFNLNVDYLTRIFKRNTSMTIKQYLTYLKINTAKVLLLRTKMSVKQIAVEAFFHDSKVFMRSFKKKVGITPSEYRRSYALIHLNNPHIDPQIPIPKRIEDSVEYIPNNGDLPAEHQSQD